MEKPEIIYLEQGDIKTELILLTPELAQYLLDTQGVNRPPSRPHTAFLAENAADHEWLVTHQGIALDTNGKMVDGQQRCMAVLRSRISIPVFLTTGLDPDVFKVLDSGKRRSPSDVLRISNESWTTKTASTVRLLHGYEAALHSNSRTISSTGKLTISSSKVLDFLDKFPEIRESVPIGASMSKWTNVTPSMCAALHFVMAHENKDMADAVADQVVTGEGLHLGDLALALRNYNPYNKIRSFQVLVHTIFSGARRALDGNEVRYLRYVKQLPDFKVFDLT